MIYWMDGNEMWKTTVDENVHLVVPAFGIDCTGVDQCWAVRLGLSGGVWNATFSADGKVDYMSQDVLYTSFLPGGYNVNDDMGASQYIHGPRGFNAMMK